MIAALQRHMPPGSIRFARPAGRALPVVPARRRASAPTALHERALAAGVTFVPGPAFYPDPGGDSELRLCFTSVLPQAIDESIRRLAACLADEQRLLASA